ncbi:hypothetical protein J2B92_17080 [Lysinibacillus sphaericus]|uniref:hypothetical protein n=1 Tax=Lysinibacillus sphaericus TaxID=1421 RepID=UPI0018CF6317|nr:hypothetical protein [Lysinibacillus sphaericus]QTB12554.1 hypothetical protein J2B92_17080 [Lysinibacillus sphaericus]
MITKKVKKLAVFLSFGLFFSFASPILANASCSDYFYGQNGDTYAVFQTSKDPKSDQRALSWGLFINKEDQKNYGSEVRVMLNSSRVNLGGINQPYAPHLQHPDYNFHGSFKNYQWLGQPGGGTLKKGDKIHLEFGIRSMDGEGADKLVVSCTLD